MALKQALQFLVDLKLHNDREWFEAHRDEYEAARGEVTALCDAIIERLRKPFGLGRLEGKDCLMRIYRDVRFSKDKAPYKTSWAFRIAPGGRRGRGVYVHLEPGGDSMIGAGLYMPTPEQLKRVRKALARDARPFKALITAPAFKRHCVFGGDSLTRVPKGFDADHPEAELLKRKQYLAWHDLTDSAVLKRDFPEHAATVSLAMKPFVEWIAKVAGPSP